MLSARGLLIGVVAGLLAVPLPGQNVLPGEIGGRLETGRVVRIWLAHGDSLEGRIEAIDSVALFLRAASRGGRGETVAAALKVPVVEGAVHDTFTVKVPWADIRAATERYSVRLYAPWKGYTFGLLGGAALGFGASKAFAQKSADLILFPLAGAGVGAITGAFVGLIVTRDAWATVSDPRIAPTAGRR